MTPQKLQLGILGAGGIARRRVLPALRETEFLQTVAVMNPSRAGEIAREFGVPNSYAEASALLADPAVEAVYIASPVFAHAGHIRQAAEAGKHILCEKPLTRTLAEARAVREICECNGVVFMEGYMMNFHGAHQALRRLVGEGKLGRLVSLRAQLSCWYPPITGAWRQDPKQGGGGALIDMATHCFSLLEFITQDRITGVFSITTSQIHSYPSEDSATTVLQLASGTHASVDAFFCVRDESSLNRLEVYGDAGSAWAEHTIGQNSGGILRVALTGQGGGYDAQQEKLAKGYRGIAFEEVNPFTGEFEEFARCIRTGTAPAVNGWDDAVHLAAVTEAAYRSWNERRFVEVPLTGPVRSTIRH